MDCQQIEGLIASAVDGEASTGEAAVLARHLDACEACRQAMHAQVTARAVLRTRAVQLSRTAPPGLRTRIAASARTDTAQPAASAGILSWRGRLSAFSAAAILVLALGAVLLPVVSGRSTVLLAAQLALDHLKCFAIDGDGDAAPIGQAEAEATLKREYGWTIAVPPASGADGVQLVAVRRCLYGDGFAAHLLYRVNGEPVSLFIMPGLSRPAAELTLLGHDELVWTQGDRTYVLVSAAGTKAGLAHVASYLQNEAK